MSVVVYCPVRNRQTLSSSLVYLDLELLERHCTVFPGEKTYFGVLISQLFTASVAGSMQ